MDAADSRIRGPALESCRGRDTYIKDVLQGTKLDRRPVTPRGAQSSAVSDDGSTIYGLATAGTPVAVALDATTGTRLWSTATRPDWRQLTPMSRPVAADGRVYVLTIPAGLAPNAGAGPGKEPGPPVMWQLVCMDGRDGRVLWTRTLGWQPYTLLDLARASNGITVHQGVVYCSTDMGLVARCDARDGCLDWVRGYASTPETDPRANAFSREGSRPLVADDTVFVAPRDHSGVLAFRCDTGECLWETIAVPSDRLLGVRKNAVLAVNARRLCALDRRTGKTMWSREFPEGTGSQGAMLEDDVVIVSAGKLHRVAGANGSTVETVDLGPSAASVPVLLENGSLVGLKEPAPTGSK